MLDGVVDIYLPDYKYTSGEMANKYSSGARDYPERAAAAIETSTKEVSTQATEVANSARALSDMARAQQVLLTQFRITEDD